MKYKNIISLLFVSVLFLGACESIDLDQTENPSAANPSLLDPTFAFNYVQLGLPDFVDDTNSFTQRITRHMAMTGGNTYDNAFAPVNFNTHWSRGYNLLNAIKILEPKATADGNTFILGASKVIRCYILMTLVDVYGDIPYREAILGSANITPKYDDDQFVYESIINELDQAIVTLNTNSVGVVEDLYYGGNKDRWIALANTLKLKMYNNCNLLTTLGGKNIATEINTIINEDKYIDTVSEDFAFRYGNSRFTPNSRHPMFNDQYELGGGAYIGNYLMWAMTTEKGPSTDNFTNTINDPGDPRVYYYFHKLSDPGDADNFTLPGRTRPEHYGEARYNSFYANIGTPYSVSNWTGQSTIPSDGFWGRDHGNNAGIPPDNDKRTVGGTYPIGGIYTAEDYEAVNNDSGKKGEGIMPIVLSSFVHFMKAELMLKGILPGGAGQAKIELNTAISQSIDKTTGLFPDYPVLNAAEQQALSLKKSRYLAFIDTTFDNVDANKKLELVIKEYYIAAWGNGIEPYNNYRRTGYPSNLQPTIEPISGLFYNCALYSADAVNNNPNVPTNDRTRKVFWAVPNNSELY